MLLAPFEGADGFGFDLRPGQLLHRLGPPPSCARNPVALTAFDYGDRIFRFQDSGRLEEITARATVLHIGSLAVPFVHLADFISQGDADHFERAGFIVSPRFGLAFVPDEAPWVTALARHCIDTWRAL